MMFAKDKGIAENYIISKNFKQTYIFRPAYIYPIEKRQEPNFAYKIMREIYPLFKRIYPKAVITSNDLASAIFKCGLMDIDKVVFENKEIKQIT